MIFTKSLSNPSIYLKTMIKKLFNFFTIITFGILLTTVLNKFDEGNSDYSQNINKEGTIIQSGELL